MEKYTYTVSSIKTVDDEANVVYIVKMCLDAQDVSASCVTSTLSFSVRGRAYTKGEIEEKLSSALAESGYKLILPEGTETFIPAESAPKAKKTMAVSTAILLAAAIGLFCIMTTFGVCIRYIEKKQAEETPEYMSDLMELDEFFRTYSYSGIDNENFGEHLLDAYIKYSGDTYAEYYSPEELKQLENNMSGKYVGIGVTVKQSTVKPEGESNELIAIEVVDVDENSPAAEAGIKIGDMIIYVGHGENAQSVGSIGYDKAMELIAGKAGTYAEFSLLRKNADGAYEKHDFKVIRRELTRITANGEVCQTNSDVGIIKISRFDYSTPTQFKDSVAKLKEQGCNQFIIDLRDNPGGYVESVVATLSYFLSEGNLIMTAEDRDGKVTEQYKATTRKNEHFEITKDDIGRFKNLEISVLVNNNTASAAELFAATVRDYSLGKIVGVKTYGKGSMQKTYMLDDYGLPGALKLTTHLYFSKSHKSYHGVGIEPDVVVELTKNATDYPQHRIPHSEDEQLQSAINTLKNNA
ncbi:MAG: hypothetical protein E7667_01855 [Ruminococcaceae bacterium]|nr:hypothetical protein [Oscillospiraceae bacterium]